MPGLFSPIHLAGKELANRILVSPMCQYSAEDGCAGDWHLVHYGALANSGAAMLIVEATAVEPRGRISAGDLGLYSDACEEALGRVVASCRRHGTAALGVQLAHAGRKGSAHVPWQGGKALGPSEGAWETIAPSPLPFDEGWPTPREMTPDDMRDVRAAFVASAERALRIGFDLVELHLAHGYLLHEFLSPVANRRTDAYGGSLENRMRFPLEIAADLRAAWPEDRILGARITGSDWIEGGWSDDDAVQLARRLQKLGFDYVTVSSGGIVPKVRIPADPGYQVPFAAKVKRETGITTCAVGLIAAPAQAERIVANGEADLVALARAFLDNPHWGWAAAFELGAKVRRPPQYERAAPELWPGATISRELD
ncbi:NADH:flavin oxidoreductase/NADH oxidase [Benzoatithermus flavus]|uniref:NADH:flavin oxidoreductase/NADH oxidase n=1 Tax=Benzoatithermus flavus TaxID=3108223 RepID=A0ABU8XUG8_9PROT